MTTPNLDLVTGATGFIGLHLTKRLLKDGRKVRILCRRGSESKIPPEVLSKVEVVYGDLRDRESIRLATQKVEKLYHCGGYVSDWGKYEDYYESNVRGTQWILDSAVESQVKKVVHLSSIAAFGTPSPSHFDDETPFGTSKDHYSRSKAEGEKIVFEYSSKKRLPITVLRPAVVYGPGGTWLEEPALMIEKNKMFLLGGGQGTCHPCYIENLLDAIVLASEHPRALGQGFIVGDGESISFKEYFNGLAWMAGKTEIKHSIPLPAARSMATLLEKFARIKKSKERPLLTHTSIDMVTTQSVMSIRKIQSELGFQPRYNFSSAIQELKEWYQNKNHAPHNSIASLD